MAAAIVLTITRKSDDDANPFILKIQGVGRGTPEESAQMDTLIDIIKSHMKKRGGTKEWHEFVTEEQDDGDV